MSRLNSINRLFSHEHHTHTGASRVTWIYSECFIAACWQKADIASYDRLACLRSTVLYWTEARTDKTVEVVSLFFTLS